MAGVVEGLTLSAAYRLAYDAESMEPQTVHAEACKLAKNPKVAARIDEGRRAAMDAAVWSRRQAISRMRAVNDWAFAELCDGSRQPAHVSAFMSSWSALCKLHGIDRHTSDAEQAMSDSFQFMPV